MCFHFVVMMSRCIVELREFLCFVVKLTCCVVVMQGCDVSFLNVSAFMCYYVVLWLCRVDVFVDCCVGVFGP